jgi:hypothetical protein
MAWRWLMPDSVTGTVALAQGQIDHRSYSKTAFGGQTHHNPGWV